MHINIKTFFLFLTLILFIIGSVIIYFIVNLNDNSDKFKVVEHNRYLMIKKADELRQSSDDLSRLANKYVVTSNPMYKENYYTTLSIRNGESERPINYDGVYWDLSKSLREKKHPFGEKISLKEEMQKLPYTKYEFNRLKISEENSNDLVNLEVEAFNAMNGLFKDSNGRFTIQRDPDQKLAIKLMNSLEYDKSKEKIMLPIDEFLTSVNDRTKRSIDKYNKKITNDFNVIFVLLSFGVILFLLTVVLIYKKILIPISSLRHMILDFQMDKRDTKEIVYYNDEIGLMTKQFFSMKRKISDDYEAIKFLSLTDPLTKLGNRRSFFDISTQLLKLAHRDNDQMTLMMLDIDLFKKVNDTYGHLKGDEVLKFFVKNTQSQLRQSDIFSRFGGEEFIILLPRTTLDEAKLVAEKIRRHIERTTYIDDDNSINITVSIGIADLLKDDTRIEDIIQRADNALFIAKRKGRNRVESATS